MDPSPRDFREDLKRCHRSSLYQMRLRIYMHKLNEALPDIGPIATLITLGELLLWNTLPPSMQSSWTILATIWGAAVLICIAIISIPRRRTPPYDAHWISDND